MRFVSLGILVNFALLQNMRTYNEYLPFSTVSRDQL